MTATDEIISQIRALHRRRRFAMKTQQKIERSLESFIRRNATNWHPDMTDKERARIKKEVQAVSRRRTPTRPTNITARFLSVTLPVNRRSRCALMTRGR
jgi:uncharacterized protein YdaU (DUF1376 family)